MTNPKDRVMLWIAGLAVSITGFIAFFEADERGISPIWPIIAFCTVFFVLRLISSFQDLLGNPFFVAFALAWVLLHAGTVFVLFAFIPISLWIPAILVELFVGSFIAFRFFKPKLDVKTSESVENSQR